MKIVKYCTTVKNHMQRWWNRNKQKILEISDYLAYILLILFFLFAYLGSMEFNGFGVDSAGNLYVGRKNQIEVYRDGKQTAAVASPSGRGWNMGISADDHILVTSGGEIYTLQLDGTAIEKESDLNCNVNLALDKQRLITGNGGVQYRLRHEWIWPTILKNGKVIYMAPVVDMLARMVFILFFILVAPVQIYGILNNSRQKSKMAYGNSKEGTDDSPT